MKRFFNPIQELQFRFPQRFASVQVLPFSQGTPLFSVVMFALCASVLVGGLLGGGDASAMPDLTAFIGTFKADLVAVLAAALAAFIAIGSAAVAIFVAGSILRWFRASV
jgi:hypothetical protein